MTFHHRQLNSMTFQAWKMKSFSFMTFHDFHDLYEPCIEDPERLSSLRNRTCDLQLWDQFKSLGNCPPTSPVSQHYHLRLTLGKMLA